jgi:hypothetical protein
MSPDDKTLGWKIFGLSFGTSLLVAAIIFGVMVYLIFRNNDDSDDCPKGEYSSDGKTPCTKCAKDFYQDATGETSCIPCPENTGTVNIGSQNASDCE